MNVNREKMEHPPHPLAKGSALCTPAETGGVMGAREVHEGRYGRGVSPPRSRRFRYGAS